MKEILITGHSGFIGRALVAALDDFPSFRVVGISRHEGRDLAHSDSFQNMPEVDRIVHLAGSVGVVNSWQNPYETYRNNLLPTLNLLEYARKHRTPFIYVSSYIYGEPDYLPVDEKHPVKCVNPYAASKLQAEMLCQAYAGDFEIPVTILRPFNVYGPGQSTDSVIAHVIGQAMTRNAIQVNDLNPKRDYLFIDDIIEALLCVIQSNVHPQPCEVYNLGCGRSHSVKDIIDITVNLIGKKIPVNVTGESRTNEIMDCYSDYRKFGRRFDWKPRTTLETGIGRVLMSATS